MDPQHTLLLFNFNFCWALKAGREHSNLFSSEKLKKNPLALFLVASVTSTAIEGQQVAVDRGATAACTTAANGRLEQFATLYFT